MNKFKLNKGYVLIIVTLLIFMIVSFVSIFLSYYYINLNKINTYISLSKNKLDVENNISNYIDTFIFNDIDNYIVFLDNDTLTLDKNESILTTQKKEYSYSYLISESESIEISLKVNSLTILNETKVEEKDIQVINLNDNSVNNELKVIDYIYNNEIYFNYLFSFSFSYSSYLVNGEFIYYKIGTISSLLTIRTICDLNNNLVSLIDLKTGNSLDSFFKVDITDLNNLSEYSVSYNSDYLIKELNYNYKKI